MSDEEDDEIITTGRQKRSVLSKSGRHRIRTLAEDSSDEEDAAMFQDNDDDDDDVDDVLPTSTKSGKRIQSKVHKNIKNDEEEEEEEEDLLSPNARRSTGDCSFSKPSLKRALVRLNFIYYYYI